MNGLIHKFLIYAPGAATTLIIAAAGVWDGLRDAIAAGASNAVIAMGNPLAAIGCLVSAAAYIAAIFFTNDGGEKAAEARAQTATENARARRHLVTVGRSLANGFSKSHDNRTLLEYMQADGGYARLRPHFSKTFTALLNSGAGDQEAMHKALLDEMDRLERKWRLV
ncbi:hypothetical protein [Novosphingobium sp. CECT 9465]|uniref:hypothetical protein n=1 Tax=Novosphingobium sp. CECT 9465 TaxID=2829794 RepID=UPI001E28C807|nr:hypothetical protein [Novosphingobium sp. CECT 9465]CAH0496011.1 hypothetical protein NVSP9465_01036 [Novosphingobium sp. CECT 9465]